MRYSVVQADEELLQQTLGIYTKGAMFWGKQSGTFKGDMTVMDALPGNYVITIIGCNSGSKASVQAILTEISNWLNTNVLDKDNLKITDFIDVPAIVRLNASYTAKEFSFKFADARGRIYTLTVSPIIYPKAGELIRKECEDKDQWGIFTDGSGGSYRQLLKANSTNCGYVPPEPAGIEKRRFCEDFDQWGEYTDGNYGTYTQLIKTNSTACGYVPPPPAGTLIDTTCEGTTKWGNFTDGAGGTRRELMAENSPDCGYVAPPPGGEPSGTYCQGFDLWGKYTDGEGGFINQLIKANSTECGFTEPVAGVINKLIPARYRNSTGMVALAYDSSAEFIKVTGFLNLGYPFTSNGLGGIITGAFSAQSVDNKFYPSHSGGVQVDSYKEKGSDGQYYPRLDIRTNTLLVLTRQVPLNVIQAFDVVLDIIGDYGEDAGGA
jgi:hypothetical protein